MSVVFVSGYDYDLQSCYKPTISFVNVESKCEREHLSDTSIHNLLAAYGGYGAVSEMARQKAAADSVENSLLIDSLEESYDVLDQFMQVYENLPPSERALAPDLYQYFTQGHYDNYLNSLNSQKNKKKEEKIKSSNVSPDEGQGLES